MNIRSVPTVGVLMYTHNRVDDARVNLEIIRNVWNRCELLRNVPIVHSFNGDKDWWPEKYLEDEVLYLENPGHFRGAEILLNEGIDYFVRRYTEVSHVIVLAPDTWCVIPEYLENVVKEMQKNKKYLAACAWGTKDASNMFSIGMSLDLNIVDVKWAVQYGLFPLRFQEFLNRYAEVYSYEDKIVYLERVFALRFKQAIAKAIEFPSDNLARQIAEKYVYRMTEREPVHYFQRPISRLFRAVHHRRAYWPNIGLITHHDPIPKQKAAAEFKLSLGQYGTQFLAASNLSYFNAGLASKSASKDKKTIQY